MTRPGGPLHYRAWKRLVEELIVVRVEVYARGKPFPDRLKRRD